MNEIMKTDYSARFKILIIILVIILVIFFHFTLTAKNEGKRINFLFI